MKDKFTAFVLLALLISSCKKEDEPTFCWECATYWEITSQDNAVEKDTVSMTYCNKTESWSNEWESKNTGTTTPYWEASNGDTTWYKSAKTVTHCNRR